MTDYTNLSQDELEVLMANTIGQLDVPIDPRTGQPDEKLGKKRTVIGLTTKNWNSKSSPVHFQHDVWERTGKGDAPGSVPIDVLKIYDAIQIRKQQESLSKKLGGKIKGYQTGGETVEERSEESLTEMKKQAGFTPATPAALPTGTEATYTPQTVQTEELTTKGETGTVAPQVTTPTTVTRQAVTSPTVTTAPDVTSYQAAATPDITGEVGAVSTEAQITPPTGTVDSTALVTGQQGSEAAAIAQTRSVSSDEIVDAATLSDIGVNQVAQATASQQTTPTTTVQKQLENLQGLFADGKVPDFAKGVVTTIENTLAARGLGASSIAGQAITAGLMDKLIPIATADAQLQQQLDLANLTNSQQSAVVNAQLRATMQGQELTNEQQERVLNSARIAETNNMNLTNQQTVALENAKLSQNMNLTNLNNSQQAAVQNAATYATMDARNLDSRVQASVNNAKSFLNVDLANLSNKQQAQTLNQQYRVQQLFSQEAAENATRQFNARSDMQVNQFFETLGNQVAQNNATRQDAMNQFNVEQGVAVESFNSEVQDARERFNATQQTVIDQSNTQWRRSINTANNTNTNRIAQLNAQNLLALTQGSQNALWQRYRDEAQWAMTSAENTLSRAHAAAVAAMNNDFQREQYTTQYKNYINAQLGQFAFNTIGKIVDTVLG